MCKRNCSGLFSMNVPTCGTIFWYLGLDFAFLASGTLALIASVHDLIIQPAFHSILITKPASFLLDTNSFHTPYASVTLAMSYTCSTLLDH